jgi:hypothetical protein
LNNISNFNLQDKFFELGRFAAVKFHSEKDALRVYLEKVKLNLHLSNGKRGQPMLYPGELLRKFIEDSK